MKFSIRNAIHPDSTACLANAHAKDGPQANAGIEPLSDSQHSEMILHDTKDFYILLPLFDSLVVFVKGLRICCNRKSSASDSGKSQNMEAKIGA